MVRSWWSLLGVGSTLDTHFMSSCYFTTTEATGEYNTKPEVWKTIVWSLRACVLGVWPDRDHDDKPWARDSYESMRAGTPLAGGWFLVPWQFSGDTEFKIMQAPQHSWVLDVEPPVLLVPRRQKRDRS